jgi:zinc transport system ATP-binding protein
MNALEFTGASHLYDRSVRDLSGGELQRVYLARSIIKEPTILLLDEPATGIDLVCEKDISRNILDYRKDKKALVIIVTHDLTAAYEHTDFTLLLNKKQIFFGNTKDAFTEENLQATFSHFGHTHAYKLGMIKND